MKKLLALILAVLICFSVSACKGSPKEEAATELSTDQVKVSIDTKVASETDPLPETDEDGEPVVTPLLYKVTDSDGNAVWLFGSIHLGYDYFYPLPDYVSSAFESADALAVEFDTIAFQKDFTAQINALKCLVYTDGTTIRDHISEETYESAVEILKENHLYSSAYDSYLPVMWYSLLGSALYEKIGLEADSGVDMHMLEWAYDIDMDIIDIESAAAQYEMLAGFSDELQLLLLETAITQYSMSASAEALDALVNAWVIGDADALADQVASDVPVIATADMKVLLEEYNYKMITERNIGMADFAEDALSANEQIFICVGAAHIVGDGGMADLLAERGYTVEIIK